MSFMRSSIGSGNFGTLLEEENSPILIKVDALVENFVTNSKRGKLSGAYKSESMSTTAAVDVVELFGKIVAMHQELESHPDSESMQQLAIDMPAAAVASNQVQRLIDTINLTGEAILQSQFGTLLLMNVTRRVLAIIREAAARNTASNSQLEAEARRRLTAVFEDEEDAGSGRDRTPNSATTAATAAAAAAGMTSSSTSAVMSPPAGLGGIRTAKSFSTARPALNQLPSTAGLGPTSLTQLTANSTGDLRSPHMKPSYSRVALAYRGTQELTRAVSPSVPATLSPPSSLSPEAEFPVQVERFYEDARNGINEYREEIEDMGRALCERAARQLHSSDTVIVIGCTNTTRRYLLEAASAGHRFKVIILDGAPSSTRATEGLAAALLEAGIPSVQVLPDSSAFAVMGVCTKALIGAEAVLANGGLLASVGTHMMCLAANHFAVPVLVATTTLKMSPFYPSDKLCTRLVRVARTGAQSIPWSTYGAPEDVLRLPYDPDATPLPRVHSPVTEYVPPELIRLYATNETEYVPSQIHRVVREYYSDVD